MLLATQTDKLASRLGDEEAIRVLAENGFDGADWSFFKLHPDITGDRWQEDDWREHAEELRQLGDSLGLRFVQAHAPFASSKDGDPDWDEAMKKCILRAMEAASIMGVTNIVVHPKQHLNYSRNEEALYQMNLEWYRSLIPYCEKWNIHVCVENMWQYDEKRHYIVDSTFSRPEEFVRFMDEVNSPWIVACLDIGHTALVGQDPAEFIRALGGRLKALHVHDVDYVNDSHTLPFHAKLDWDSIMKALADVDYQGIFTFEADNFLGRMPNALLKDGSKMMERTGRYLIGEFEKYLAE